MKTFIFMILLLLVVVSCGKEDDPRPTDNQIEFMSYGDGNKTAGYYDGNTWTMLCYADSLLVVFSVPTGDTLGVFNNGVHSILIINGEVLFDEQHSNTLVRMIVF